VVFKLSLAIAAAIDYIARPLDVAGWSSLAARRAHNPKVVGSNPAPATKCTITVIMIMELD
jgi:hypothetical protein